MNVLNIKGGILCIIFSAKHNNRSNKSMSTLAAIKNSYDWSLNIAIVLSLLNKPKAIEDKKLKDI